MLVLDLSDFAVSQFLRARRRSIRHVNSYMTADLTANGDSGIFNLPSQTRIFFEVSD